jgi:methylated-DNA-[protein]-cysteine S-methyltransferase
MKYTIFKTRWGYFGLAANGKGLSRTVLPCSDKQILKRLLLAGIDEPEFERDLLKSLQNKIIAYFNGCPLPSVFRPLNLEGLGPFTKKVLNACQRIPAGKTISYSQLARMIGKPRAGRAVGNALAKNPVPLVIPCHRVIHSDGTIGKFSAPGGTALKKMLIGLERLVSTSC